MKKLFSLLAVLCLLVLPVAHAETQEISFGPFSLTIDPEMPGEFGEFSSGAVFMTLYPSYLVDADEATNMKFTWINQLMGLQEMSEEDIGTFVSEYFDVLVKGMQDANLVISDSEILDYHVTDMDAKPALIMTYSYSVDYSGLGEEYNGLVLKLYQRMAFVETETGTYVIASSVGDEAKLQVCDAVLETLRWTVAEAEPAAETEAAAETETVEGE